MAEEIIDFGNFSRKITVNPIVPLQVLQLKYRNSQRVQATIIGKVYSSHIDVLDVVPVSLGEEGKVFVEPYLVETTRFRAASEIR